MAKSGKGSSFEREICKILSLWWTDGTRDDIFWRTSGSGARAKTRSKKNQTTFGQYGDIQATDPIGQPLLDIMSIELKRGYSKSSFADMFDKPAKAAQQIFESFLEQALQDSINANTPYWVLIVRRDRKETCVFMPRTLARRLKPRLAYCKPSVFLSLEGKTKSWNIFGTTLSSFLDNTKRIHIEEEFKR